VRRDSIVTTRIESALKVLRGWRQTAKLLSVEPVPGESAFINALAERTAELVDGRELDVASDGKTITLTGRGPLGGMTSILMPFFILRAPAGLEERLEMALRSHGDRLQQLLSRIHGSPWPADGATTRVAVNAERLSLWWGGTREEEAVARLRPMIRAEIGI
jgi:hypothetical protein